MMNSIKPFGLLSTSFDTEIADAHNFDCFIGES
jgi:hypothetical protein